MKIATSIGDMYDYCSTPAEAVRSYAGTGFKYLDYNFYNDHKDGSPFMLEDDNAWMAQIKDSAQAADECGFTFVQAHLPGYNPMGEFDHKRCMRAMLRTAEACGMLKIPAMVVHSSYSLVHRYPMDQDAYFEYNKKFLLPILEVAEKYGTILCVENTSAKNMGERYFPRTAAEMNDFVKFIDHPLLKCCWDTGHAVMEGKFDQYADLMELGDNLKAVHIHDNNGWSDQHLAPYCGRLQLSRIIEAFRDMDFKGYFTFEVDRFLKVTGNNPPLPMELRREILGILFKLGKSALEYHGMYED